MAKLLKLEKSARYNRLIYELAIIAHNQKNNITASPSLAYKFLLKAFWELKKQG